MGKEFNNKKLLLIIAAVSGILFLVAIYYYQSERNRAGFAMKLDADKEIVIDSTAVSDAKTPEPKQPIKVYITGEVIRPGVYEFASDSRIVDAVNMAGGFTADADIININLAQHLKDAQHIIIYNTDQTIDKMPSSVQNVNGSRNGSGSLVNMNTADKEELMSLKGIGEVLSEEIIKYRENKNGFKSIDELKKVDGIGEKAFEDLKELVTVE